MQFIDTHCHLDLIENVDQILFKARKAGVNKLICPSLGSNFDKISQICEADQQLFMAMGIYPFPDKNLAYQELPGDLLDEMQSKLIIPRYQQQIVAIGECGLDFSKINNDKEKQVQIELFIRQIEMAKKYLLPMILHTRGTGKMVLDLLLKYKIEKAVFHSFSGSKKLAQKIVNSGYYLGIGGLMTMETGLQEIVKNIDLKYLLLETDAPYLIPKALRGKVTYNEPQYIPLIAKSLAEFKQVSLAEVAEITTLNAYKLFNI